MSNDTSPAPRQFARAKSEWRRYAGLGRLFEAAAEWEEGQEEREHKAMAAEARLAESERKADAVDAEAAARRARLDAEADEALVSKWQEIERRDAVLEDQAQRMAANDARVAAQQAEFTRLSGLNAAMSAALTPAGV